MYSYDNNVSRRGLKIALSADVHYTGKFGHSIPSVARCMPRSLGFVRF